MLPRVEMYSLFCLSIELPSFAHYLFQLRIAKCLIRLKNITRVFWKFDYSEIYFYFNLEVRAFQGGTKVKDLVVYVKVKFGSPLTSVNMSLAPN